MDLVETRLAMMVGMMISMLKSGMWSMKFGTVCI